MVGIQLKIFIVWNIDSTVTGDATKIDLDYLTWGGGFATYYMYSSCIHVWMGRAWNAYD